MPIIHIVEEDQDIREESLRLLNSERIDCRGYRSTEEFVRQFDPQTPGCVILDLLLPDAGGDGLLEILSRLPVPPPIIVICAHGDIRGAVRAIQGGALDFLEKPITAEDMLARVREAIAEEKVRRVLRDEQSAVAVRLASLTARECDVMKGLVAGESAEEIGARYGLSTKTIYTHRSHVLVKTGVDSIASPTRLAMQSFAQSGSRPERERAT